MAQQATQTKPEALEWTCQGISPLDEPCDEKASYHCETCGLWFCSVHADDEQWHHCAVAGHDEGGES